MPGTPLVTVYNRALFKIGATSVSDPNESSSQGRVMRALYASVARNELRKRVWNFAKARAQLPASATAPAFGFDNAFPLPADFLRLVSLPDILFDPTYRDVTTDDDPPYAIESGQILTNFDAPLNIIYLRDLTAQPELWDDSFVEVVACALAAEAASQLTKSDKTAARVKGDYKEALFEAKRVNAFETPAQQQLDSSWVTTRLY